MVTAYAAAVAARIPVSLPIASINPFFSDVKVFGKSEKP